MPPRATPRTVLRRRVSRLIAGAVAGGVVASGMALGLAPAAQASSPSVHQTATQADRDGTPNKRKRSLQYRFGKATPKKSATTPKSCVKGQRGIPQKGAYLGAAVSGTSQLDPREKQFGRHLPLRRNYFNADQVGYAVQSVRSDLKAGRLPWISFKLPYSWAEMANGRGDAWARDLSRRLGAVNGPVWIAFHHEPEGDGPIQDWVRMQRHLSPIVKANSNNVAVSVIYTGWDLLFDEPQYRLNNVWPGSKYVDILGFDMYNDYGANRNGRVGTTMLDANKYFKPVSAFAKKEGVEWAVGEVGYTHQAANMTQGRWLNETFKKLKQNDGIALTYFDSSLHSIADWTLDHRAKLQAFKRGLPISRHIC